MSNDDKNFTFRPPQKQSPTISAHQARLFRGQGLRDRSLPYLIHFVCQLKSLKAAETAGNDRLIIRGINHRIDEALLEIGAIAAPDEASLKFKLDFLKQFDGPSAPGNQNLLPMLMASAEADILRVKPVDLQYRIHRILQ